MHCFFGAQAPVTAEEIDLAGFGWAIEERCRDAG
jgi:hypothetical protein